MNNRILFVVILCNLALYTSTSYGQQNNREKESSEKNGLVEHHDKNGNTIFRGYFINGRPKDTIFHYYPKGNTKAISIWNKESDTVLFTSFFPNGKTQSCGEYFKKKKEGSWQYYRQEGVLLSEENYLHNLLNGSSTYYYFSGSVLRKTIYKNGFKHGKEVVYFESGEMQSKQNFHLDTIHGTHQQFYPTGELHYSGEFDRGIKEGIWIEWSKNSDTLNCEHYIQGILQLTAPTEE